MNIKQLLRVIRYTNIYHHYFGLPSSWIFSTYFG